ncbi:MAG: hypothetical protein HPY44_02965 [Armatimonadetes bacterium]|nr:hypothetical protein [Armatimonadota bacterium]
MDRALLRLRRNQWHVVRGEMMDDLASADRPGGRLGNFIRVGRRLARRLSCGPF